MNELMYSFRDNNVRVVNKDGQAWFAAKDVCEVLDIKNTTQAVQRLEEDEVTMFNIGSKSGETNFVNEYGLYTLVLGSRKSEAREFKRWITHEVIPSIRKNGIYATVETTEKILNDPDFLIKALQELKKEREEKTLLEHELQAAQPKVFFAEAVGESDNTISVGELAKLIAQNGYPIGQNRLYEWMRENGYLIKREGIDYNTPTQQYIQQGLLRIKEGVSVTAKGSKTHKTTRVTGKGQFYFVNKFLGGKL